ncbi:MAG: hypothetical protein QOG77_255 [Solirubrobacteraceae bacterium]|nr:hypothetical protein [Solirubrobacteraceae bacterium]
MSLVALVTAASLLAAPAPAPAARAAATAKPGHVWTIVLENKNYEKTFGAKPGSPYLGTELPKQGVLLTDYYATGHLSLDNYISMVSGQPPNTITQSDCQTFQDFAGTGPGADGVAVGQGCVYPASVKTVADQLVAKGLTYRGYMEDMGDDPAREAATCAHPAVGARDNTQGATAKDQYATRHNPFVYFHSIIDDQASCDRNVVNLRELEKDLGTVATTPNYSFITPDLCADGHDDTCVNEKQKGGYEGIDEFLREWVPRILASPAFAKDGLLIVTFDEAEDDDSACCDEQTGPNTPRPGIQGPGGGKVGAVLISRFVKPGTTTKTPINHYGYLRSIEDLFGLDHLAYAAQEGLATFQSMKLLAGAGSGKPVRRFTVKRKGRRLIIRVSLAPGVIGKITVKRGGQTLRRFTTGGRATLRVAVPRKATVVLRAVQGGRTVKRITRRR